MNGGLSTIRRTTVAFTIVVLVIIVAVFIYWHHYTSPQKVFNDMLVNNLTTSNVTKNEISTSGDSGITQRISLQLGGTNASRWLVTVNQQQQAVSTDSIGTPSAGYVRYTKISGGKDKNYAKTLNVWAKATTKDSGSDLPSLFARSLLDLTTAPVPPLGNPNPAIRNELLDYIHAQSVFTPDYKKVTTATINGRQVYVYPVSVRLTPYIAMMQVFAGNYGLKQLQGLQPSDYQSIGSVRLSISVDKLSHQMTRVEYKQVKFSETYTDYGIARNIIVPTKTISPAELQKRLSVSQ